MKKNTRLATIAAIIAVTLGTALSACTSQGHEPIGGDIIAPVTISANELQGATVELLVGQVLNINIDPLEVDSYDGEVAAPQVAEFTKGHDDGSAQFNPGVTALAAGTSAVMMTNEDDDVEPLTFVVVVSER